MLAHAGAETRSSSLSSFLVYLLNIRMYVLEVLRGQQINLNYDYRISANSCRDNYSFLRLWVRQLFKGDNYSKEETINFFRFGWALGGVHNLNCCRTM